MSNWPIELRITIGLAALVVTTALLTWLLRVVDD